VDRDLLASRVGVPGVQGGAVVIRVEHPGADLGEDELALGLGHGPRDPGERDRDSLALPAHTDVMTERAVAVLPRGNGPGGFASHQPNFVVAWTNWRCIETSSGDVVAVSGDGEIVAERRHARARPPPLRLERD
jgi:hypothetical protein